MSAVDAIKNQAQGLVNEVFQDGLLKTSNSAFFGAFVASLVIIIMSELGDKTFFIAAIMSMKHNHITVFGGALSALAVMTGLSVIVGAVLPQLIDRKFTHYASISLFAFFGVRLLLDGTQMKWDQENDELAEVEAELNKKNDARVPDVEIGVLSPTGTEEDVEMTEDQSATGTSTNRRPTATTQPPPSSASTPNDISPTNVGNTNAFPSLMLNPEKTKSRKIVKSKSRFQVLGRFFRRMISPILLQAFTLTFLAEWGDRSQIATIALAASKDVWGVTIGATLGHAFCTGIAVLGGKYLASQISERTVTFLGGGLFLIFAVVGVIFPY